MATTTSSTPNQDPTTTLSSTTSTHSSHSTTTQASLATSQGSGTWHPTAALIGGTVAGARTQVTKRNLSPPTTNSKNQTQT
ncbi:hypothetical protein CBS63078_1609 [Aspergillus niger]|nr:hypothetical protein CBS115989_3487 [Aspergillus niger]KAI2860877.1 hypothetical protein CBS11232_1120 [Aspergillus niger]KAI2864414.1 hypothetical protein CBS12448_2907 [Aspergillus niger]KAI2880185.1 hypothetical protein CBS115988_1634 [Aspergillus niger]KAI2901442.1 hypothetical protein CBS13152_1748 [Aspergillus niger]